MKVKNKIKKIVSIIFTTIATFSIKSHANLVDKPGNFMNASDYGVKMAEPSVMSSWLFDFIKISLIPIILAIGLILFLKKSKKNLLDKIITIIIVCIILLIIVLLFFIIWSIVTQNK